MLAALLCAALCTLSQDPAVLLVRVLDVSDARMGGDAILVTDSAAGRARHVLIDASDRGRTVVARLAAFRVDTLALVILSHPHADRSEEHTSELQSRLHLVCRLLLEKK